MEPVVAKRRRIRLSKRNVVTAVAILILVTATGYLIWQNTQLRSPDYQAKAQDRANQALVQEVSKILLLPSDQTPTIATITKIDDLKKVNAAFYADAQNDDKILFYSTKAVIYREAEHKIINLAPVTLNAADQKGTDQSKK